MGHVLQSAANKSGIMGGDKLEFYDEIIRKMEYGKDTARKETYALAANFNDVLYLLQDVVVKAPRVAAVPCICAWTSA